MNLYSEGVRQKEGWLTSQYVSFTTPRVLNITFIPGDGGSIIVYTVDSAIRSELMRWTSMDNPTLVNERVTQTACLPIGNFAIGISANVQLYYDIALTEIAVEDDTCTQTTFASSMCGRSIFLLR